MSIAATTPIDTGKITGRRTLRFHSIDEAALKFFVPLDS
jgi:hypothetical protein